MVGSTLQHVNTELAELNAVLLGLKAEVDWSDSWGLDQRLAELLQWEAPKLGRDVAWRDR